MEVNYLQMREIVRQLKSERFPIVWIDTNSFRTADGYIRAHWLTLQVEDSPEIHSGGENELTSRAKKAPPGYSCLDGVQVWLTEGARSRNHKKTHLLTGPVYRISPFRRDRPSMHLLDRKQI